ncbi:MAG: IS1595 family transposase [Burkholderiaceae bacterium]|nr:IS1595 family transposase [Burkholderiaceae bacterium]
MNNLVGDPSYLIKEKTTFSQPTDILCLEEPKGCPDCGSIAFVKNGTTKLGKQRYRCKDCGKSFVRSTDTIIHRTRHSVEQWLGYIHCMMQEFSLRECAKFCQITLRTAFIWRHKVLDALQNMMSEVSLGGNIQADETYFRLSFKGRGNVPLGRKSRKRGSSMQLRGLSKEQVCVVCGVTKEGMSVSKIASLGKPTWNKIKDVLDGHIEKGSTFVTDSFTAYRNSVEDWGVRHVAIPRGKYKLGNFNIQLMNNYHARLKEFVNGVFNGVATKYLNNYLVYFNLLHFAKGELEEKEEVMANFVLNTKCQELFNEVQKQPAIPLEECKDCLGF